MNKKITGKTAQRINRGKLLGGALVSAILGVTAGILLAPESGKKVRKDIKKISGDFYQYLAPQVKKLKHIGEAQYHAFVAKGAKEYAKIKRLSLEEQSLLLAEAKRSWTHIREEFR